MGEERVTAGSDSSSLMRFEVLVEVRLRPGIADPQGSTVERALPALGFEGIDGVRFGKAVRLRVVAADEREEREKISRMSERLLANPVIEDTEISVLGTSP